MDLLANYNDDSLNLEDSPSVNEKEEPKADDTFLEDEWLSFEKMISPEKGGTEKSTSSNQYLVHGMVAYPGMSLAPKQIVSAPEVEKKEEESDDSSDDEEETEDNKNKGNNDIEQDDDDAFFKMRKKVKERDRSSSSDRSSDSSRSSRSRSLSPPQLSPVDSEHSQHSLPPPDLFDPSQDMHYRSPEVKIARSPEKTDVEEAEEKPDADEELPESEPVQTEEREIDERAESKERKPSISRESKSARKNSHRSRSRSKHRDKESSKRRKSRSRSKGRHHRHSSKDRHRHRRPRHKSRDRKRSRSKERKRNGSREKKSDEKASKRRSKSKERKRSKSRDRKRSRSRSKGRDRKKSERDRKRSRSKERRHSKSESRRRDRSSDRKRRHSKSRSRSRDRKKRYSRSRSRERLRSRSPILGKKMTFKERMRKELLTAGKKADEAAASESSSSIPINSPGEILKASAVLASIKSTSTSVTPQMALLQTMAAMHQKAQEITGVAVPKYYNPAAVNPLKYAEQVQKRKLLWSKKSQDDKEKEKEEMMESQWKSSMGSKFQKLMGIKGNTETVEEEPSELSEEQKRKQEELFSRLDKEYEFARMATHTHRGVGLGFSSQVQFPSTQPPH